MTPRTLRTPGLRRLPLRPFAIVALLLCGALTVWAVQAASRQVRALASPPASMATLLPQGALLTIESPDFAALLKGWNDSPEQKAWLDSANYSVFANSRLFGRLNDARAEFESATGKEGSTLGIDGDFLTQIAGRQSVFAWYDVARLEFIYITRLTSAQAAAAALLQQRAAFSQRQAAGATFYLRRSADPETGVTRTVAFAQVPGGGGTLLLLATREDLMAAALQLVQRDGAASQDAASLAQEPWYQEAVAALPRPGPAPVLHMVLNLDRLVPMPYFRSYWVQQNITRMKQYRAAVSDLYRDAQPAGMQFREERALLLKSSAPADPSVTAITPVLEAIVPPGTGVYHALATQQDDLAVTALEEKLLGRVAPAQLPATAAEEPDLTPAVSGAADDLETYIDTPPPVSAAASNQQLSAAIRAAGMDGLLTCSSASTPVPAQSLWVPIHSAVVLHAATPWQPEVLLRALQQSLRGDLTAATLGIEFRSVTASGQTIYALTGPKPLFFAVRANLWLLADDQELLLALLRQAAMPAAGGAPALQLAGFDHAGQRAPYLRLASLVDGTNHLQQTAPPAEDSSATPAFFSQNLGSLSTAFAALRSQHFVERRDGDTMRQTVTYQWQRP